MNAYGTMSHKMSDIAPLPSIVFRLAQQRVSRIRKKPQTGCGGLPSLSARGSTERRSVIAPMANRRARGRLSTKPEHEAEGGPHDHGGHPRAQPPGARLRAASPPEDTDRPGRG